MDESGILSNLAVKQLALSNEEAAQVQKSTSALLGQVRSLLQKNLEVDSLRSDAGTGVTAYKVSSFEPDVMPVFDDYARNLSKIVGRDKAGEILMAMPVDQYFNSFGKFDSSIVIKPPAEPDDVGHQDPYTVVVDVTDPKTGRPWSKAQLTNSDISRLYPMLFDNKMNVKPAP